MAAINTKAVLSVMTLIAFIFTGCRAYQADQIEMQSQIDGLKEQVRKMEEGYKPGFGELMGTIQTHHAKLWYAGTNENWKLAEFEIHEIEETIEKVSELHGDRYKANELIPALVVPFLESTRKASQNKDVSAFQQSYTQLTTGCNNCHVDTGFEFIVIQAPVGPAFPNQRFSIKN
ncbi:MAG: hypothetical protein AB1598_04160 [Thermodesulfobacteriota bacterium]